MTYAPDETTEYIIIIIIIIIITVYITADGFHNTVPIENSFSGK
jgi:hypothetical protein